MCGGTIEFNQGDTVGVCDSCGTKQTLPKLDDEKRIQLYDRANYFRRENEFDKAMGIYEMIIADEKEDAEAYWGIVLCKYGIEYVEDPRTHKRIPTVNRAQYTSVFDDEDFQRAIQYADGYQRDIYEAEAKTIDAIQKGILEISNKEEPFDVFICYKETDASGSRTQDSVLAQDIYKALTNEGYKVFFSRITLESKLGQQYEPYIFAALNSAKVMLVVGTKKENFEAVWVKNEWSRFLSIIKNDSSKVLIPCYKGLSPYDMPEEFTYLQSQDMGKIGFMQDLLHGISKVVKKSAPKETVIINSGNAEVEPLLKRAFIFLEDGDWENADQYCERVLDIDPENAMAYVGKLMVDLNLRKQEQLGEYIDGYEDNQNYQKARRYADNKLNSLFNGYLESIENIKIENTYQKAIKDMNEADSESAFLSLSEIFKELEGYKDSKVLFEQCTEKADECSKKCTYNLAKSYMDKNDIRHYQYAIEELQKIPGWKDSIEQIGVCERKIQELEEQEQTRQIERERKAEEERVAKEMAAEEKRIAEERAAKKRKKIIVITSSIMTACITIVIVLVTVIIPSNKYKNAESLFAQGKYSESIELYKELGGYKDSSNKLESAEILEKYYQAEDSMNSGKYKEAYNLYQTVIDYKDAKDKANKAKEGYYNTAVDYVKHKEYTKAEAIFSDKILSGYKNTEKYCKYITAMKMPEKKIGQRIEILLTIKEFYDVSDILNKKRYKEVLSINGKWKEISEYSSNRTYKIKNGKAIRTSSDYNYEYQFYIETDGKNYELAPIGESYSGDRFRIKSSNRVEILSGSSNDVIAYWVKK